MGGRQPDLTLTVVAAGAVAADRRLGRRRRARARSPPRLTAAEAEAHAAFVAELGEAALWARVLPARTQACAGGLAASACRRAISRGRARGNRSCSRFSGG